MASSPQPPGGAATRLTAFPTTQWSLVLEAGAGNASTAHSSLEGLCRAYWYPVYAFLRRGGNAHHAAEDLTQGFFAHLLATAGVGQANPERGRFRAFLLVALRHYTTSEWRRAHAAKRGGPGEPLPIDLGGAAQRFAAEPADPALTPDEAFDRSWALDVIQQSMTDLRHEYLASGRSALFDALAPFAWDDPNAGPQAVRAQQLGMNEHAFAVAVHRLRKRWRERLRERAAATVENPAQADDELHRLLAALRPRPHAG